MMRRLIWSFVGMVAVMALLGAKSSKTPGISMAASDWTIVVGRGTPERPTADGSGWLVEIPTFDGDLAACAAENTCPSINYVTTTAVQSLSRKSLLTLGLQITVSGDPVFNYQTEPFNTCPAPASVRLLLQRDWSDEFGRWWSNPLHVELAEGFSALSVPLVPDQWTSVSGLRADSSPQALSAFQAILKRPYAIGMTFGGGCFFGHGVNVSGGTATFHALNYTAN